MCDEFSEILDNDQLITDYNNDIDILVNETINLFKKMHDRMIQLMEENNRSPEVELFISEVMEDAPSIICESIEAGIQSFLKNKKTN